ncbi:hypothetical protein BJF90_34950 [Pseudonocardia sp. CNS-004]|nr:hypothetical protein BJF90_34950 [Pseudonocardia sp. CNS-004]
MLFGNGVNGRRPGRDVPIEASELTRTRGAAGNLRHGLPWLVPALGPNTYGQNRQSLAGGADRTSADDLAIAARETAVERAALLTDADLVAAARGSTGMAVGRAEVVARFDRRLGDRRIDGVRTLVVLPYQPAWIGDGGPPELIRPSQAYLDEMAARLYPGRVLGERLVVQGPVVVAVDVAITVTVEAGAVLADVERAVRRAIYRRLAAVAGADADPPWPLGRDLAAVDLTAIAATVPRVRDVLTVMIGRSGGPLGTDPIPVPPDGLVVADRVDVDATGGAR